MFSDFQFAINEGWKRKRRSVNPVRQRKKKLCVECGKKGFEVKLDYKGNQHIQRLATVYDVTIRTCPRCGHVDKEQMRIEGRGKGGPNFGKMFGGL